MTILVLLGAGASYGSEPVNGLNTPPLGDKLFGELCKLGGAASRVPSDIKKLFGKGFELGMAHFYERHSVLLQEFHRELSYYLSQFTPTNRSYYIKLLELLRGRDVIYSSLNYDMMLEEAVRMSGTNVVYNLNRRYDAERIIKPHGSINFWPDISTGMIRGCSFSGGGVAIETDVKVLDLPTSRKYCLLHDSLSPAISMYAKGKIVSVCPSYVEYQQNQFSEACRMASVIIILGVRVVAEDVHIWDSIRDSKAEVTYFGSDSDRLDLQKWVTKSKKTNMYFSSGYFEKALATIPLLI
ncbi:hypothetical protein CJF43_05780 [Pseudomonas fragi]|uniref:SIR2-like domain-containing protein n=1 Tax=Pseudomonas fragi TaxID=296 RepID=A0A266LYP1_PSEFR|nr:hypothetical protein [Pseudomonas fragi]OZY42532.1 hypothetical protein CJF43_05780 [Pseudomonas fragi]